MHGISNVNGPILQSVQATLNTPPKQKYHK